MTNNNVILELDDRGVATITLNSPEKHNAFDEKIIAKLTSVFEQVDNNDEVKIMVLRSEGKNFSAGADLDWMKRMASYDYDENIRDANALAKMLHTLNFLSIPTIARVQGAAMGGGAGLVCCCDIAIATNKASFAFSEAKLGLIPATIGPYVLQSMGSQAARRYFLTAERFSAERALTLGMVSEVVDESELDEKIDHLIDTILTNSSESVKAAKQLINDIDGKPVTKELMQLTSERIADIRASEEGIEGLAAFLEKRKPSWVK
ncbi:MAG: enoyl-CoA hydratase/isomerase family protein [Gammaproteobacteria bacterium]|jgi:methylglutaconyl-CoA hydratase|nr:enoyl-CoA hydratase/isomerase family protein [Gammaproteobacteria bacterium]